MHNKSDAPGSPQPADSAGMPSNPFPGAKLDSPPAETLPFLKATDAERRAASDYLKENAPGSHMATCTEFRAVLKSTNLAVIEMAAGALADYRIEQRRAAKSLGIAPSSGIAARPGVVTAKLVLQMPGGATESVVVASSVPDDAVKLAEAVRDLTLKTGMALPHAYEQLTGRPAEHHKAGKSVHRNDAAAIAAKAVADKLMEKHCVHLTISAKGIDEKSGLGLVANTPAEMHLVVDIFKREREKEVTMHKEPDKSGGKDAERGEAGVAGLADETSAALAGIKMTVAKQSDDDKAVWSRWIALFCGQDARQDRVNVKADSKEALDALTGVIVSKASAQPTVPLEAHAAEALKEQEIGVKDLERAKLTMQNSFKLLTDAGWQFTGTELLARSPYPLADGGCADEVNFEKKIGSETAKLLVKSSGYENDAYSMAVSVRGMENLVVSAEAPSHDDAVKQGMQNLNAVLGLVLTAQLQVEASNTKSADQPLDAKRHAAEAAQHEAVSAWTTRKTDGTVQHGFAHSTLSEVKGPTRHQVPGIEGAETKKDGGKPKTRGGGIGD